MKLVDDPYSKPALQFFDIYKGPRAAGELIATFELIELDYSGYLEVIAFCEAAVSVAHGNLVRLPPFAGKCPCEVRN